jgi:hypothetical protein
MSAAVRRSRFALLATNRWLTVAVAAAAQSLISLPSYQAQLGASARPGRSSQRRSASSGGGTVVVKLLNNYRSHSEILALPSKLFYDDELRACANPRDTDALCPWEGLGQQHRQCPVLFVGVEGVEMHEIDSPSWYNPVEASRVSAALGG